jgi:hypothetical protein
METDSGSNEGQINSLLCRIWGTHSGGCEEFYLLEYNVVYSAASQPMFLQNVSWLSTNYMALYPKRQNYSFSSLSAYSGYLVFRQEKYLHNIKSHLQIFLIYAYDNSRTKDTALISSKPCFDLCLKFRPELKSWRLLKKCALSSTNCIKEVIILYLTFNTVK